MLQLDDDASTTRTVELMHAFLKRNQALDALRTEIDVLQSQVEVINELNMEAIEPETASNTINLSLLVAGCVVIGVLVGRYSAKPS